MNKTLFFSEHPTMFETQAVNTMMAESACTPDAMPLVPGLWNEGELACLFAESNVGKSILAVQVASKIAENQKVLYLDCELSSKQFQMRYSNSETQQMHFFPENFLRATIAPERLREGDFCENFIDDMEREAMLTGARVIILDNLSYACITSEKGDDAGKFMLRLKRIQMMHGWSMLVIAHTPKKDPYTTLTTNDLAGSKKLFNFFDSVFALGKAREEGVRYLKQLKCRVGEFTYPENNVAVCEIVKEDDGYLHLVHTDNSEEYNLLCRPTTYSPETEDEILQLSQKGWSVRAIAEKTQVSRSTVQRIKERLSSKASCRKEAPAEIEFCFISYSREVS